MSTLTSKEMSTKSATASRLLLTLLLPTLLLLTLCSTVNADVYIYIGSDGERLITDRPPHRSENYQLISRRKTVSDAGDFLAGRPDLTRVPDQFRGYIQGASDQYNIDPALVEAVIQVESDFDPNAVSRKGATGLMQLMQQTARQYNVRDRFNPRENIYAGVKHLSRLMDRFNGELPLAIAAYNAGSSAVENYSGIPPYPETRRYVIKVMNSHNRYRQTRYGTPGY
ncbi:MAG: lytic transglycosylase domain-containing protein [bacterium]